MAGYIEKLWQEWRRAWGLPDGRRRRKRILFVMPDIDLRDAKGAGEKS